MPIPFILGGIALASAAAGIKKGVDAKHDLDEARDVNATARRTAEESERFVAAAKEKAKGAVEDLGRAKIRVLTTSVSRFVSEYEQIKNINLRESAGIDELRNFSLSTHAFKELKQATYEAKQVAVNGLAAVGSGALLAYGTYSVVMSGLGGLLVTATTGTALSSLTGAAAVNATLAWLGGGALGVGYGMAGGMVVLGGLVVGPALAVGGALFASQARKALNDAYGNREKAEAFKAQAKTIGTALKSIYVRSNQLVKLLDGLDTYFVRHVDDMASTIKQQGTDWMSYSQDEKQQIYRCVQLASAIKIILDTPLLKESGELDQATTKALSNGESCLRLIAGA